jgi:hypothetical protein
MTELNELSLSLSVSKHDIHLTLIVMSNTNHFMNSSKFGKEILKTNTKDTPYLAN